MGRLRWSGASLVSAQRVPVLVLTFLLSLPLATLAQETRPPDPVQSTNQDPQSHAPANTLPADQVGPDHSLTFHDRLRIYRHSMIAPSTVVGPAFGAAIGQARNTPPEWGQGGEGYGRRFASGYARALVQRTITFGVAAADHEDPRFFSSHEGGFSRAQGFWGRTRYAVVNSFIAERGDGSRMPAIARIAGPYVAAFISNAWYPAASADTKHAFYRGSTALGASVGFNVLREFWPDVKKKFHRKRANQNP